MYNSIKMGLRAPKLRQLPLVETAMGRQTMALLATLDAACQSVVELGQAAAELFRAHPDYAIIMSFPGLAESAGSRVLAKIGDDRKRFADAKALKASAGTAPVTRASGRSISLTRRRIKNDRLAAAGRVWGFAAMGNHPAAQDHYRRRREHGDHHAAAIRHLVNKFLGQLHYCLQNRQMFDTAKAFPLPTTGLAA